MMKQWISALLIAVSIVVLGLSIKAGIDNFAFRDRIVTVRGLAERDVEANLVTWPLQYSLVGNDLGTLYDRLNQNNATIVNFLKSNGLSDDEITVNPPSLSDRESNNWSNQPVQFKYGISTTITVTSTQVEKVRDIMSRQAELLRNGIAISSNYVNYEYTALNDIKPEMIAEATRNAREAADQFAKDSGSRVGKIKTASQGQFSINDTDDSTPNQKRVRVVSTIVYYLED